MKNVKKIIIKNGECWYGIGASFGVFMPLTQKSVFVFNNSYISDNQVSSLLISNKGRYIFSDKQITLSCIFGFMTIKSKSEIVYKQNLGGLKQAYLEAITTHFKPNGVLPPKEFFTMPQYNTWIELMYEQNQKDILNYAHKVLENGLPAGIIMVDDKWSLEYGDWRFDPKKFPDPKAMIKELHQLGFKIMLWCCPMVSEGSVMHKEIAIFNGLVKDSKGQDALRDWWNGKDYIMDLSNPATRKYFKKHLDYLCSEFGVDGFKFDAGDINFYKDDDITHGNVTKFEQCKIFSKFGAQYEYNEFRASFNMGGKPIVQRLADKLHSWTFGLKLLVPDILCQSILGYCYGCPDMIGGGQYKSFINGKNIDEELFVRYAQASALMPMMQYSAAPWRVLNEENKQLCIQAGLLHSKFADKILKLAQNSSTKGDPIVRYMDYDYPNQGLAKIKDQFMLGEDVLVAPVVKKNQNKRKVVLPQGKWKYCDGTIYGGGKKVVVNAPIDVLPYFEKQ